MGLILLDGGRVTLLLVAGMVINLLYPAQTSFKKTKKKTYVFPVQRTIVCSCCVQ